MVKRKKKEINDTLKAEDFKEGDQPIKEGSILSVKDIMTKFSKNQELQTVCAIQDKKDGQKWDIFLNNKSLNNLIEGFGDEDDSWLNKHVTIVCEKEPNFKKLMLVVYPNGTAPKQLV